MGVLKCKPIFYVLRLYDCKYCLLLATQEDARAHTIINVMNVHVLYCDLMDFPYMDIFMRDVFHIPVSPRSTQPADGHISLF